MKLGPPTGAAPPPEPQSWWRRAGALEVLATQDPGAIVLAEGLRFDEETDAVQIEEVDASAVRRLWALNRARGDGQ